MADVTSTGWRGTVWVRISDAPGHDPGMVAGTLPGGNRTISQNLEKMDQCIARRQQLEPEIRGWLTGTKPVKLDKPTQR